VSLVSVLLVGAICAATPARADEQSAEPLRRAAEHLWNQQAKDGGWHSPQYGLLRSGQALTPMVLHALLRVPETICHRPPGGVGRAIAFIIEHSDDEGFLGREDPDLAEYPVYSTSYSLLCLLAPTSSDEESLQLIHAAYVKRQQRGLPPGGRPFAGNGPMIGQERYALQIRSLAAAQFSEANGFRESDPAYGGWGFDKPRLPGQSGHMDVAHTRRALQALSAARKWDRFQDGMFDYDGVTRRAEAFLRVVQRHPGRVAADPPPTYMYLHYRDNVPFDGGFYFSPVVLDANKGRFTGTFEGRVGPYYRSYATATCDGLLALLACGVSREDERVAKAADWLRAHPDFDYPEGVPRDHPDPWGDAIRFYHYAVRAEAYDALSRPGDWRQKLAATIAKTQAADGSFRNAVSPLMKEDDPILCTALAVIALAHCAE
jgi:hypothetical protein